MKMNAEKNKKLNAVQIQMNGKTESSCRLILIC